MWKRLWSSAVRRTIFIFVICVIPLNAAALIGAFRAARLSEQEIIESNEHVAKTMVTTLDRLIERMDYWMYDQINHNPEVTSMFRETEDTFVYQNAEIRSTWAVQDAYEMNPDFDGLFFILERKEKVILGLNTATKPYRQVLSDFLGKEASEMQPHRWDIHVLDGIRWLIKATPTRGGMYGEIINLSQYENQVRNQSSMDSPSVSFVLRNEAEETGKSVIRVPSARANIALQIILERGQIARGRLTVEIALLAAGLLLLLIAPLLVWYVHRTFISPIAVLNKAHAQFETDEKYRIQEKADTRELSEAYNSFNTMAYHIQTLKIDLMQRELDYRQMQLQNLQLQIRPHFLLNTFNLIYFLSENGDYASVRELILFLSDYFRYIYRKEKDTERFGKELKLIEAYIKAVNMRYPGQVHLFCEIDPEAELVRVPPLLIHNFIENCVTHAMVSERELNIVLCASCGNGYAVFEISDDGRGMDAETVNAINRGEEIVDRERVHVGLLNSYQRLRYFYGDAASLTAESTPGEGSMFTIRIPYEMEEEVDEAASGQ